MSRMMLFAAVAVATVATLALQARGNRPVSACVVKLLPVTLLLIGLGVCGESRDALRSAVFATGLAASLLGDLLLGLPRERFLGGLAAFLAAHVIYVAAFLSGEPRASAAAGALPAIPFALVGGVVFALVRRGAGKLVAPVAAYAFAIVFMCAAACARGQADGCWLAPVGATLFFASDGVLAVNRFRRPFTGARPLLFALYVAGQSVLTASMWR